MLVGGSRFCVTNAPRCRRYQAQIGIACEAKRPQTRSLRQISFGKRLQPPNDTPNQQLPVSGVSHFAEDLRVTCPELGDGLVLQIRNLLTGLRRFWFSLHRFWFSSFHFSVSFLHPVFSVFLSTQSFGQCGRKGPSTRRDTSYTRSPQTEKQVERRDGGDNRERLRQNGGSASKYLKRRPVLLKPF